MRFNTIGKIQQISEDQWTDLMYDHNSKNYGKKPQCIHVADSLQYVNQDVMFSGADHTLVSRYGKRFFYHSEADDLTWRTDDDTFHELLREASLFLLGAQVTDVRAHPENFVGLPLWSFVAFFSWVTTNEGSNLFPPHLVPGLMADFKNLRTDDTQKEFFIHLSKRRNGRALHLLYLQFRSYIIMLDDIGGSFRYSA